MAVAKNSGDSGTPNAHTGFGSLATSLSLTTYTVGAGADVVLIGILTTANGSSTDITNPAVTWDGVSMTRIATGIFNGDRCEFFQLANPNTGNKTMAASWTGGSDAVLGAISFTGAGLIVGADTVTNTGTSSAPSTGAVTSSSDGATVAACCQRANINTNTQTNIYRDNTNWAGSGVSYAIGGATNTHSWTSSASSVWSAMGIHIPAATVVTSVETVTGWHPDAPRLFVGPKVGWSVSQPTFDAAPFGPEMVAGWYPDRPRLFQPLQIDLPKWSQQIAVIGSISGGSGGARMFTRQFQGRTGPLVNDAAPFSPEMAQGWHPDQPRMFLGPRIPLPDIEPAHAIAPFSPEMAQGWHPDQSRAASLHNLGQQWWTPEIVIFSPEMVIGWHPDQPRLFLGPRIPGPDSQVSPTDAPFGPEMMAGWHPETSRATVPKPLGWQWWPPEVAFFSIEMVTGWHPDQPRLFVPQRIQPILGQTDVVIFSPEMVAGWQPDRPRLFLALQLPQPMSQTSFDAAPFGPEMVLGWQPDHGLRFVFTHSGVQIMTYETIGAVVVSTTEFAWTFTG